MAVPEFVPATVSRRRKTDVAYLAFGWVALYLLTGAILEWLYGSPTTPGELSRWQGIGMLVLLPLSLTALAAAVIGLKNAVLPPGAWRDEPGLVVLSLLLFALFGAFLLREADRLPRIALAVMAGVYVVSALLFAGRWFLAGRRRQVS